MNRYSIRIIFTSKIDANNHKEARQKALDKLILLIRKKEIVFVDDLVSKGIKIETIKKTNF